MLRPIQALMEGSLAGRRLSHDYRPNPSPPPPPPSLAATAAAAIINPLMGSGGVCASHCQPLLSLVVATAFASPLKDFWGKLHVPLLPWPPDEDVMRLVRQTSQLRGVDEEGWKLENGRERERHTASETVKFVSYGDVFAALRALVTPCFCDSGIDFAAEITNGGRGVCAHPQCDALVATVFGSYAVNAPAAATCPHDTATACIARCTGSGSMCTGNGWEQREWRGINPNHHVQPFYLDATGVPCEAFCTPTCALGLDTDSVFASWWQDCDHYNHNLCGGRDAFHALPPSPSYPSPPPGVTVYDDF